MSKLTHIDETGRPRMVDISDKAVTAREAVAQGFVRMGPETLALALSGDGRKGDVRTVAEIAGVMAAKRTSDLIPMCHPLAIARVEVKVEPGFAPDVPCLPWRGSDRQSPAIAPVPAPVGAPARPGGRLAHGAPAGRCRMGWHRASACRH